MEDQITTLEQFAEALATEDAPEGAESQEVDNAQPEEEAQNDDQPGEADGEESQEEAEEGEQPETPDSSDDTVISWETASGEKFEVPVAELKDGYMRSQDYTHKTQQLARDREVARQHAEQQLGYVQEFAKDYGALFSADQQIEQLGQHIATIDRYADPVSYNTAVNDLMLLRDHRSQIAGRISQFQQFKAQETQQALSEAQRKAAEELSGPNGIKGFGRELVQKWNKTGRDYGFSDQELNGITDPRMLRVLNDAMQYRDLQAKKPGAVAKVNAAPVKPPKQIASKPASNYERDLKAHKAKPTVDSLARLLAHQYTKG